MEEMGQGYFSNTSKKQKGEAQVCDYRVEKERADSKDIADGVLPGTDWK